MIFFVNSVAHLSRALDVEGTLPHCNSQASNHAVNVYLGCASFSGHLCLGRPCREAVRGMGKTVWGSSGQPHIEGCEGGA